MLTHNCTLLTHQQSGWSEMRGVWLTTNPWPHPDNWQVGSWEKEGGSACPLSAWLITQLGKKLKEKTARRDCAILGLTPLERSCKENKKAAWAFLIFQHSKILEPPAVLCEYSEQVEPWQFKYFLLIYSHIERIQTPQSHLEMWLKGFHWQLLNGTEIETNHFIYCRRNC